ncbi:MAG: polyprenyl synthetase family protein [Chloroflexi bacterium]|nr:polyprenyl synthetase family protein [Chloroflexota bacterium]
MSNAYLAALERELDEITCSHAASDSEFFNIFAYHLGRTDAQGNPAPSDTGKRIRPLLCLWACEAAGGNWRAAIPAAAAIELIHNFSLIHDDIEDDSAERRGRATVWKIWGLAQGINAGDAMFVLAHLALDRLATPTLSLERYVEIHSVFDQATLKLTQGQYLDIAFERADQVTLEHYFEMVRGKTAALLAAACEIGARVATTDEKIIRAFAAYGENLGIAFQIADDVLGLWGDPALTGKSTRTDLESRKKSYPVLAAMQSEAGDELRALYAEPNWGEADFRRVERILRETGARALSTQQAESFAARALDALNATGLGNDAVARLRELAIQVVHREK